MKKTFSIIGPIIIFSLLLSGCTYDGDGEFRKEGTWPLVNYSLSLPEFEVKNGTSKEYKLRNFKGHTDTIMRLTLKSNHEIYFLDSNLQMSFTVQDKKGNAFVSMDKDFFKHMHRMQASGKALNWNKQMIP